MKQLICEKDVEALKREGKSTLYVDSNTILTPSAKDAARLSEIEIVEGAPPQVAYEAASSSCETVSSSCVSLCDDAISSDLIYSALKALHERGVLNEFLQDLTKKAFVSEALGGGKIVRGDSVKLEPFDGGKSGSNVRSQEVLGKGDGQICSGFFELDHARFEQDFGCEVNCHLLEGSLEVTINGENATAQAGDVFCIPARAKVIWNAEGRAKLFYSRLEKSKG